MQTILLVEDDDVLRELVQSILNSRYNVLVAGEGSEALAVFRVHSTDIDLLLIDAGLPYLDGWDLAALFEGVRPGIKCLMMSGDPGLRPSPWWFIAKPFSPSQLCTMVEQVLMASPQYSLLSEGIARSKPPGRVVQLSQPRRREGQ